jgi:RHS repeat-associated protein
VSTTDTSNVTTTVSNTYDDFGRVITSTDARGATTTTTYNNTTGQVVQSVATMPTASGTATVASTAYTYGSATDPRALLTGTTSTDLGQTISGTYNADGALVTESLPLANGQSGDTLTQAWTIDPAGQTTTLKTTESVGGNIWQNDQRTFDGHGQVSTETSNITGYAARTYGYDAFGRLTGVADGPVNACQTRTYSYDVNGNRTASATYGPDATGACGLTGAGTPTRTVSTTFDATDTATSTTVNGVTSNPNYDYYGRVTSLPAAASPNALAATVGYYNSDLVKSITTTDPVTSATLTQSITYDPSSRMLADTNSGSSTTTTAYYYADASSASPAWTATIPAGQTYPTSITRQIDGLNGNTIASWTGPLGGTGTSKLDLVNLHGDIVCTANPSDIASPSDPVQVIDEFGQTLTGSQKTYGWVGGKDKVTDTTTGLVFMGARLYDSLLGQFIQRDPVYGGNDNAYGYPQDPVLGYDLSGQWGIHIHWRNLLGLSSRNDSWAIGQFFALAVRLTGGKCGSEGGLRVCYGGWHLFANGGTTWGDTFVTSRKQRQDYIDAKWWPGILRHEKRHRDLQWRRFGGYFGPMYLWAQGLSWLTGKPNVFEKQAGLCDGHYTTVCHHGK